jgi:glyoxylase-like metal-dependent hydrolase (beta-lactamase superfamily II)
LRTLLIPLAALAAAAQPSLDGLAPGSIRYKWIHGSICAATNRDPRIQVVPYNDSTIVMRENMAIHWEAPFTYLLVGKERALLIDTGATPEAKYYPLRATVDGLIRRFASLAGKADLPLTIVMTSPEDIAQNQGLRQFEGRPNTTIAQPSVAIDLGGRLVTAIPTRGTHKDGVTYYDAQTGLLFTGDLLFPGRVLIANDADYVASLERLKTFAESNPVKWIMGGHIEMQAIPGLAYSTRTNFKPNERVLQMEPEEIGEALLHARRILGKEEVAIRANFILINRLGPDVQGRWPADLPRPQAGAFLR